ncbi:hypothetical protein [Paenibacillus sp. FSL R7-0333]
MNNDFRENIKIDQGCPAGDQEGQLVYLYGRRLNPQLPLRILL